MPDKQAIIQELRKQVKKESRTERKCAKLLKEIAWILLHPGKRGSYITAELNTTVGRPDLIVWARSKDTGGFEHTEAYIWELKAPQLPIFKLEKKKDNIRACPTKDLYIAENQLIHYHSELSQNRDWQISNDIQGAHHVKFGGIIIGRDENLIQCERHQKEAATKLAKNASRYRNNYFYEHNHINLLTWDRVLEWAEFITAGYQSFVFPSGSTDLNASQPSTDIILKDEWAIVATPISDT